MNDRRQEDTMTPVGAQLARYGIVFLLLFFGVMKWTRAEAQAIQPFISHSPLSSWLYGLLGVQGVSTFFWMFELTAPIAIAAARLRADARSLYEARQS